MEKRKLGKSNIKVSPMGLGCFPIGGTFYHDGKVHSYGHVPEKDAIDAIEKGIELGITILDSADVYGCGRSEEIIGKALKGRREDFVIATKFGSVFDFKSQDPKFPCRSTGEKNITPEYIRKACDDSLKRLQTNYIDIYQLHWSSLDDNEKAQGVKNTLEELVDEGKILSYGWSTDSPRRAKIFADGKNCSSVQFTINLTRYNYELLKLLDEFNLGGLIRSPLGMGILTGKYNSNSDSPTNHYLSRVDFKDERMGYLFSKIEEAKSLLTNDGRTLAQGALGYIWAQHKNIVPIPGFRNSEQVEENAEAMVFGPLSNKIVTQIDELFNEMRTDMSKAY